MTETTNLFPDSAEPATADNAASLSGAGGPRRAAGDPESSAEQTGAVRSWPGSQAADGPRGAGDGGASAGKRLTSMLLPELQRLAQSLGMTGTGRMRKGQLIAAIEERQHGGGIGRRGSRLVSAGPGGARQCLLGRRSRQCLLGRRSRAGPLLRRRRQARDRDSTAKPTETQSSGTRLREPALTAPLSGTPWNQTDQGSSAWSARTPGEPAQVRRARVR